MGKKRRKCVMWYVVERCSLYYNSLADIRFQNSFFFSLSFSLSLSVNTKQYMSSHHRLGYTEKMMENV